MRPLYLLGLPVVVAGLVAGGTAMLAQVPADSAPVTRDVLPPRAKDHSIDAAASAAPAQPSPVPAQPAPDAALDALPTYTPPGEGAVAAAASNRDAALAMNPDAPAPTSLRGAAPDETVMLPDVYHSREGRETRAYRQQPPIIPHSIDKYQIDLNANQCLACHDWTNAGDRGAPTLSMTHYMDREGHQLDTVAGTRWFCNQCHVPQADAPPLVPNTFRPSAAR